MIKNSTTVSYGSISVDDNKIPLDTKPLLNVWETSFNLVTVITGSGMLCLPFAAKSMGWSAMLALLTLGSISMYSFHLIAQSINGCRRMMRERSFDHPIDKNDASGSFFVDYLALGKFAFGHCGESFVEIVLGIEMLSALVSFLMNIGININLINGNISSTLGTILACLVTILLSSLDLKLTSYSSAVGSFMTTFIVLSLFISGMQLEVDEEGLSHRSYTSFDISGLPISLGLIAFCFGGHGTFPRMYDTMSHPEKYPHVLGISACMILTLYAIMMGMGYWFFAQFTLSPGK